MIRKACVLLASALAVGSVCAESEFRSWAETPPLGWNSWDCFGTTVTEAQTKAQADAMAKYLKPTGWTYLTVDIQWYEPNSQGHSYAAGAQLQMDEYSRLTPALTKFPSAADGKGFKPLADYVHSKGLKFGIHIMRGISKQAMRENTPILGTDVHAVDIANQRSTCSWNPDMFGVDMSKEGAQEYYDSLFKMYASWGVDLVKVDDIARPYDATQQAEIEAIRKAIDKSGRPMVLSLSPGDTPIEKGEHVMNHANMWRISDDFWDRWLPLYGMFGRLEKWTQYRTEGSWPDADMLPFGIVEFDRETRFTKDEQVTCMSLWCIARSPLILGADMTKMDEFTVKLLTNPEVLSVNQKSANNHQLSREDDLIVWVADVPGSDDKYVALFNAQSKEDPFDLSVEPAYKSQRIGGEPKSDVIDIKVPIKNARRLVLVVGDGGNGAYYDHAVWIEPTVSGPAGTLKLTDLDWGVASSGWGEVRKHRTVDDRPITLNGKELEGIGAHAVSTVEFELPEGYDTFTARGMMSEGSGGSGRVEFMLLVNPEKNLKPEQSLVSVDFADLGFSGKAEVRDLWAQKDLGEFEDSFGQKLPLHGSGLYRISPSR
jgi:alpha-galactosidase